MKKEDLKNFENRLLEDVIHKCNIGYISNVCKMFVDFYKKNSSLDSLSEFMKTYIYYIGEYNGKRTLTKITESVFIECFDSKDFLAKKENLNHFKNFTTIENYPLFIFYLKNRYKNEGFIGILYWDNFLMNSTFNSLKKIMENILL